MTGREDLPPLVMPDVVVDDDGTIFVWMEGQDEPWVMQQRDWAMLTIAVDTQLSMRKMWQSERGQRGEVVEDPDYLERVAFCEVNGARLREDQEEFASWYRGEGLEIGWDIRGQEEFFSDGVPVPDDPCPF